MEHASAVEQTRTTAYSYKAAPTAEVQQASSGQKSENKYNLPELGGAAPKDEPPSRKDPLTNEFAGDMPLSARQDIASPLSKGYEDADAFQSMAAGMLTSASSDEVKKWFSARHATAELSLSTGDKGVRLGSFDLLVPIYDTEKDLVFTQVGIRRSNSMTEDYRTTINAGIGYRHTLQKWLAGVNAFYDRDITGKNGRFGLGVEAFTDNLKTSANIYVRATDWHKSPDLEDYLERPANGYDMRVEANLPSLPQLGGKLVYEQYFGDQVGLFGAGNRQKDPQAVTVGVSYSPVPMITAGVDYRQGQGGMSDTTAKLTLNYQFGVPLLKQLSLDYAKNHKLENSRYDLVNRNYEVVLDYREKDAGQILIPSQINGTPNQPLTFPITVTDRTISNFTWTGTATAYAQPYGGGTNGSLTLPAYADGGNNNYTLQVVGTDRFGRVVQSNLMQVRVNAFMIALDRSKGSVMANGTDTVQFTASLQEPTGAPKTNTAVTWDVQGNATVTEQDAKTDGKGQARLKLTSRFASAVRVTVQEPQGAKAENEAAFAGDQRTAKVVGVVATPATLTADGKTTSTLTATITDANGNPVGPGAPINWTTSSGTLSSASTVTTENSTSSVVLTSAVTVGTAKITAKAVAGTAATSVAFTADNSTARVLSLVATPPSLPANGAATSTLVATIEDANGNPVGPNVPVTWTTSGGKLSSASSATDASSKATVVLTSALAAGAAQVTAKTSAGSTNASVAFTADNATAKVVTLVATPPTIPANNAATSSLIATVEDANGNPVGAGVAVTWTTSTGTLSGASSSTDTSGKATITLKGTAAGSATVKAAATAGASTTVVSLVADNATAKVASLVATPTIIPANNAAISTLVATIVDANNNPVGAGVSIAWTTSAGVLSSVSTVTDASGKSTVNLKGTAAGAATVKATAAAGSATAAITLVPDNSTAKVVGLIATPSSIAANGSAISTLVASIEDANGNPVGAGVPVSWTTSSGALSSASTTTDASGKATVNLSGTVAGSATVKASAVSGSETAVVTLFADNTTAKIVSLVATPTSITANGSDASALVATLQDAHGNPVGAGVTVAWTTSSGALSSASTKTDASGKATVNLTGTSAGSATVKAVAAAGSATVAVALIADNATAKVVSLVATPTSITANGSDTSTLVATLQDAHGNPVGAGVSVAWTTSSGALSSASTKTDASGKATVDLAGTSAGSATVKAAAAAGSATVAVALIADNATAKVVNLVATPALINANGSDTSALVATLQDAHGNPVGAGVSVAWTTNTGTLSSATSATDASGKATITLKGTAAGTASVKATATAGSATATVVLVADNASAKVVSLVATPTTIVADGRDSSDLVATLQDAQGNAIGAGVSVVWTTSSGTLSGTSSSTDASGKATITLKGTIAGTASVKAAAVAGSATASVVLLADSSTSKVVGLVASPTTLAANGNDSSTLTASVEDANGNAVSDATVTWSTTNGSLSGSTSKTAVNGKATITLTSPVAIGDATVKASAIAGSSTVDLRFIADSSTSQVVSVKATPTTILANGIATTTLVASVEDANGNPMGAGVSIRWDTTQTGGSLSNATTATDSRGKATVSFKGTKAEAVTITATGAVGASGSASATIVLTADASTAKVASLIATPTTIAANGSATSTLVATLKDANGNDLGPGLTVNWSTSSGTLSAGSSVTNSSGQATVALKGTSAGSATVTATATAGSATAAVTLAPDTATAKVTSLVATPSSITANGTETSTLVATLKDANGNTMGAGVSVTWATSSGTLSAASTTTNSSGQTTVTLKGKVAGSATVTASAVGGSANAAVTLIADTSTAKVVSLVASPTTIKANGSDVSTFVATLKDANNNDLGAGITVNWSTSSGVLSAATSVTNSAGEATVTLKNTVASPANVTATAVGGSAITGVTFVADASTAKVTSVVATPTSITANGTATSTLVATVKDANGNAMFAGVTVNWNTSSGTLSGSSSVTNTNGEATITLKGTTAGSATITASAAAGSATATVALTADLTTARIVGLTASQANIPTDGNTPSTILATIRDANGNNVGAGVNVSFTTSAGALSAASAVTNASGVAAVNLVATHTGSGTVTASVPVNAATATVGFYADASSARVVSIVASPSSVASDGTPSTLSATVNDANGNLVPGVTVNWATTLNTLSAATSTTNASGVAVVNLSGTTAGTATVTAQTTVSGNASATVDFEAPAPVVSSFTASDSTVMVGGGVSTAARLSWSGANMLATTTYRITVVESSGGPVTGPSVFVPSQGASGWWLNSNSQSQKGSDSYMPYSGTGLARATLTACNGQSCSSFVTTFRTIDGSSSNGS